MSTSFQAFMKYIINQHLLLRIPEILQNKILLRIQINQINIYNDANEIELHENKHSLRVWAKINGIHNDFASFLFTHAFHRSATDYQLSFYLI